MRLAARNARGNSLVTINVGVRFICSPLEEFNMSLRSRLLIALSTTLLGSTAASAGLITVTSYEMNNCNGASQFTTPTGGQNYFDFSYTKTGEGAPTANAGKNGSENPIPYNGVNDAPLSGG